MNVARAVTETVCETKRMSTAAERSRWLRRQQESGLSIQRFCEENNLSLNTFYQWRSKYGLVHRLTEITAAASEPTFKEIKLETVSAACNWAAELQRPNGVVLRVGANLSAALLEQLLRVC